MFRKILVANRGEIAVRAFRAATELGIGTVAVFPHEDRFAEYRLKADESYQIGEVGHPVRAYLDADGIIAAALDAEVDAIYPGYGFLSENAGFAQACADNGITFIGPGREILELTGDKAKAIAAARVRPGCRRCGADASDDVPTLLAAAEEIGYPVFVKAVSGGGRGMRRVDDAAALEPALVEAMREAKAAFGDARMYLEEAVISPGHRGADPGRQRGQRDPPVRAGLLGAAPAPEGGRTGPRRNLDPALQDDLCRRGDWSAGTSATPTPAPSSSCSAPTAATCSSR